MRAIRPAAPAVRRGGLLRLLPAGLALLATLLSRPLAAAALPDEQAYARLLQTVDYVAVDYPEAVQDGVVVDDAEYAEMREFAGAIRRAIDALGGAPAPLAAQAAGLQDLIEARAAPAIVFDASVGLRSALLQAYPITTLPARAPDPALGQRLYAEQCAACHGAQGRGDGIAGGGLEPPPTDFTDAARARTRSLYGLYSTITLGVAETGMLAYAQLSDHERWSLAFFVGAMHQQAADAARGADLWSQAGALPAFATLITATEQELATQLPDAGAALAWLRIHPEAAFAGTPSGVEVARRMLQDSAAALAAGDRAQAYDLALRGYLEGVEMIEPALNASAPALVRELESAMIAHRSAIQSGADPALVEARAAAVADLLERARAALGQQGLSPALTLFSSFIILAREGVEAILLIAAMALYLRRTGSRRGMLALHGGWIGALVAGGLTWIVSTYLVTISGAARELTEGLTALLAALVLIWVGVWMHQQMVIQDWTRMVTGRLSQAAKASSAWWIALLAFLAVYREAFETILFYQALWLQVGPAGETALFAGAGLALLVLLAVIWALLRLGTRLPVKQFFRVCSITLIVLAVIFVGKGILAMQEAGHLPMHVIRFPRIDLLGVFPSAEGVLAQLVCAVLAVYLLLRQRPAAPARG